MISALSNHEIRFLQERLGDIKLQKDICASLPVELLLQIAQYAELEDILRFRCVSHAWHNAFNNMDFCTGLAKYHFPLLSTAFSKVLDLGGSPEVDERLATINKRISQRARYLRGDYASRAAFSYRESDSSIYEYSPPQYKNGRFAYQCQEYGVAIKCLRQNTTKLYMHSVRQKIEDVSMLVFS